jgi:hypothetical protein
LAADDDIADLLGLTAEPDRKLPPQPTRAQMVEAFEAAVGARNNMNDVRRAIGTPEHTRVSERRMVRAQSQYIDAVQTEQMQKPLQGMPMPTPAGFQAVFDEIAEYEAEQAKLKKQQQLEDQVAAVVEVMMNMGISFKEAAEALSTVMRDASDAIIAAMRPILDLLDQSGAQPSEPVCPSHACALRGGRCPRCDRGRNRHARR